MQFIKTNYAPEIKMPLQDDGGLNGGLNKKSGRLNGELNGSKSEISGRLNDNIGGLNGGLNEGLKFLLSVIRENPGIQVKELAKKLNRSIDTLDKQIKKLTKMNLIERRGSKKTGGYWTLKSEGKNSGK
jgi:ATP-dependent DNA helicase RecG